MTLAALGSYGERVMNHSVEPLMSLEDAAKVLGCTHWTVRNYVKSGKLVGHLVGRRYMIEPGEVRGFIKRCVLGSAKA